MSRRSELGVPVAGTVYYTDPSQGDAINVDLEAFGTGSCSRCNVPNGKGYVCAHLLAFIQQMAARHRAAPPAAEIIERITLPAYKVASVRQALPTDLSLYVPTMEEVPVAGHVIQPLVGRKQVGRPPKAPGKRGPKVNPEKTRILSCGEAERLESKRSRGTASAGASSSSSS